MKISICQERKFIYIYMNSVKKNRLIDLGWKEQRRINTDKI